MLYNPIGGINDSNISRFNINSTEEDLFMLNTIQDNFDISINEINIFKQIWEMYFEYTIR